MAVEKKMILVFVVFAMFNLCLAKPRWVWLGDDSSAVEETFQDKEIRVGDGHESSEGKETLRDNDDQDDTLCPNSNQKACPRSWV